MDDRRTYHILIHCVDSYIRLLAAAGGIGLLDRIDGNPKKLCLCQWYVCFLCICMCVHTTEDTNTSMINLFIFAKFAYERPFYHWWPVMHVSVEKTPTPLSQNDFGKYWRCSIVSLFHDFNVSDIIKNFTSPRRECIPDTT